MCARQLVPGGGGNLSPSWRWRRRRSLIPSPIALDLSGSQCCSFPTRSPDCLWRCLAVFSQCRRALPRPVSQQGPLLASWRSSAAAAAPLGQPGPLRGWQRQRRPAVAARAAPLCRSSLLVWSRKTSRWAPRPPTLRWVKAWGSHYVSRQTRRIADQPAAAHPATPHLPLFPQLPEPLTGKSVKLSEFAAGGSATLIMFICNHW